MSKSKIQRPIAVDLFCGAGGMSVGFEQAGFDVLLAIDKDAHHVCTHHRNFPYGVSRVGSVAELTADDIRRVVGEVDVDVVYGGPPCQGFSNMGARDTNDPRNSLVGHFCRVVAEVRPKAFVMENVPGMNLGNTQVHFDLAIRRFRAAGYNVAWPAQTLNARDFGVPQDRRRLFIIGVRSDISSTAPLYPDTLGTAVNVRDALEGLPQVEDHPELFKSDSVEYPNLDPKGHYARISRGLEPSTNDFSRPRKWSSEKCSGCLRTRHMPKTVELYASTPAGSMVPGHKLPKLHPEGISPTLRAGSDSEHGSHTAPRPVHPHMPRVITAREAARLHGYPDWFSFYPKKWHAYRQIGNSVCPPVARAVGGEILRSLGIQAHTLDCPEVYLNDEFQLPKDRQRTHKRIETAAEFPKVIDFIWNEVRKSEETRRDLDVSVQMIEKAISSTDAKLPRVRASQFLSYVARYRNVRKLLRQPLLEGYTLKIIDAENGTGRFVREGTVGSVTYAANIKVTSAELKAALVLPLACEKTKESDLIRMLESPHLLQAIAPTTWRSLVLDRDLLGSPLGPPYSAVATTSDGEEMIAIYAATSGGSIPKKRLVTLATRLNARFAAVILAVTNIHVFSALFHMDKSECFEISRVVFRTSSSLDESACGRDHEESRRNMISPQNPESKPVNAMESQREFTPLLSHDV